MVSGTHGRVWYTNDGNNIAFSIYCKANCKAKQIEGMTIEIAKTIVEVFETWYSIKLEIKYPNDLVKQGKKIGGILVETKLKGEMVEDIVIGIGINTNGEMFAEEIKEIATSIKKEFGIEVDNKKIIKEICKQLEQKRRERKIIE